MQPTIAVLDASIGETSVERNFRRELDAEVDVFEVSEGEFPPVVTATGWRYDGVVISGSQTSVYDDLDWIHETTEWLRRTHATGIPTLGVCWGHQIVAQALGGRIVDMREYELGYRTVTQIGDDQLFEGVSRQFTTFETHSDRVAELPAGAKLLARNDFGIQAFRVDTTYGVQFHPEYDRETAEWATRNKDLPDERIREILDRVNDESLTVEPVKQLFDNFLNLAVTHQPQVEG